MSDTEWDEKQWLWRLWGPQVTTKCKHCWKRVGTHYRVFLKDSFNLFLIGLYLHFSFKTMMAIRSQELDIYDSELNSQFLTIWMGQSPRYKFSKKCTYMGKTTPMPKYSILILFKNSFLLTYGPVLRICCIRTLQSFLQKFQSVSYKNNLTATCYVKL